MWFRKKFEYYWYMDSTGKDPFQDLLQFVNRNSLAPGMFLVIYSKSEDEHAVVEIMYYANAGCELE